MAVHNGYSATVALRLRAGGANLVLSHVGPNWVVVRDKCAPVPSGDAELVIKVNRKKRVRKVFLPNGVPGSGGRVNYF